ncbi:uncharacterized protein K441DRAFT_257209 [Cenococcum geophilum 1.58]|uniref:uncharacterized protein n=1 Tax=Cenococcum geophilum 1.58 TaxID=794803 RepID=UPI00358E4684|nr:hypothetical protein K441DRAFT_257209 [Cenococcum geophilum 1.58]
MNTTTPDPCRSTLIPTSIVSHKCSWFDASQFYLFITTYYHELAAPITLSSTHQHRVGKKDVVIVSSSKLAADNVAPVKIPRRTPKSVRVHLNTQ